MIFEQQRYIKDSEDSEDYRISGTKQKHSSVGPGCCFHVSLCVGTESRACFVCVSELRDRKGGGIFIIILFLIFGALAAQESRFSFEVQGEEEIIWTEKITNLCSQISLGCRLSPHDSHKLFATATRKGQPNDGTV